MVQGCAWGLKGREQWDCSTRTPRGWEFWGSAPHPLVGVPGDVWDLARGRPSSTLQPTGSCWFPAALGNPSWRSAFRLVPPSSEAGGRLGDHHPIAPSSGQCPWAHQAAPRHSSRAVLQPWGWGWRHRVHLQRWAVLHRFGIYPCGAQALAHLPSLAGPLLSLADLGLCLPPLPKLSQKTGLGEAPKQRAFPWCWLHPARAFPCAFLRFFLLPALRAGVFPPGVPARLSAPHLRLKADARRRAAPLPAATRLPKSPGRRLRVGAEPPPG